VIKFRDNSEKSNERTILFVCIENAGRSQIAEGLFCQRDAPKGYPAISAGTRSASQINPLAIQLMNKVGIDISSQKSKIITDGMIEFRKVSKHGLYG
jgi:arsenate reductase (thioredoxin)